MADEMLSGNDAPLVFEASVPSTNDVAIDAALGGAPHGWAVCADEQTAGRGRRGHTWASPAGSLYMSVVLRPQVPMQHFIALPAVCAMGVIDALHGLGLAGNVGIKWPNDIVARVDADDRTPTAFDNKLAGILVEARASEAGPFAVVGMGVNMHPVEIEVPAEGNVPKAPRALTPVSLDELLGEAAGTVEVPDVARRLRDAVIARVGAWAALVHEGRTSAGPLAPILSEYFDLVPMLGHQVAVLSPNGRLMNTGVFAGLDVWGRACVMTPGGEQTYPAEAVSLRAL